MRRVRSSLPLLCCCIVLASCDETRITFGHPLEDRAERLDPWIETDRSTYTAFFTDDTIEIDIGFTFTNHSRVRVAVPRCVLDPHDPVLDRLSFGREWREVFTPIVTCWDEPLVINPGQTRAFTLHVRAGRPHTAIEPRFRTTRVAGTYRLRWDVYEHDPFSRFGVGRRLPIEHRVSNAFRIEE